ncbi:MAG: group 1 glycosyl transferase, partial [Thermoprotei archaeon]
EFEIQHQGVDPVKIYRIPHGTLLNPFLGIPRFKLIRELGLDEGDVKGLIVVTPGFLRRDKGLDILAESLRYLRRRDITIIAAGELRDKEVLRSLDYASKYVNVMVKEKYLSTDEMLKLIALADVVMLPYRDKLGTYSVSGILHLSMGSFKPIVGTRVPRLIELYQFTPRLTAPPRSPKELSKRVSWVLENYDYAVNYMAYIYGYAVRTQWLRTARKHLALYQELISID